MLDVLDLEGVRQPGAAPPATQGGFDLIWDGGPLARPFDQCGQPTSLPSLLGAWNPSDATQARQPRPPAAGQQEEPRQRAGRQGSRPRQLQHRDGSCSGSSYGSSGGAVGVGAR